MRVPLQITAILVLAFATAWFTSHVWEKVTGPVSVSTPMLENTQGSTVSSRTSGATDLTLPPLAAFDQTLNRPIFVEGRRAPSPQSAAPPRAIAAVHQQPPSDRNLTRYRLLGIVSSADGRRALIETPNGTRQWHLEHDKVDEWKIVSIGAEMVALEARSTRGELWLYPKPQQH